MKLKLLIFVSSLTTLFASCQTATNNTLEEFKKVDSSLQKSNSTLIDNVYSTLYGQVQQKKDKNPQLAFKADTLYQATEEAYKFIDTLKQKLNELDPSGTQLDIGTKLLINTANSMILTNKLKAVYLSCTSSLVDKQKRAEAENIFSVAKEIKTNQNWTSKYFDETPTVAVVTILNKFKNDCSNLAVFSLTEIKNRLVD
jgi:hypothetical protein